MAFGTGGVSGGREAAAPAAAATAAAVLPSSPTTPAHSSSISSTNTVGCLHRSRCLSEQAAPPVPRGPTTRSSPWPSALRRISSPPRPPRALAGLALVAKQALRAAEGRQRCSRERRE